MLLFAYASTVIYQHCANTDLYANWVANTYAVTFDKQSGTNGSDTVSATYDATMPSATAPMRTGYTFGGYYDQANGAGTQYYTATMASVRIWDKAEATTLFAKWTAISYALTYVLEDGTNNSANPGSYTVETATITLQTPTKTGYTFGGWFSGSAFTIGNEVTEILLGSTQDKTLYAKWTANSCAVTFDKQSGTGGSDTVSATYDATMPSAVVPTKTGYTFGGYYDQANGAGTQYYTDGMVSSRSWDKTEATTLYAKWTPNNYSITYDLNNGTNNRANPGSYTIETETITLQAPTKIGYTFDGWFSHSGFTGSQVMAIALGSTGDRTLYAKWTPISYTVTFDKQSGTDGSDTVSATYDATMPLATPPMRTGYTFGGYYDQTNGGGTQYYTAAMASTQSWDKTDITPTLYAKWIANTSVVTLDMQSGANGSASVSATYDAAMPNAIVPEKTGYLFGGY
ncbi:MAG: hypothetical protein EOM32_14035, partial [Spirochaetia bacterium]|nr:hypothetical protein [Spirochaetia bacterium]